MHVRIVKCSTTQYMCRISMVKKRTLEYQICVQHQIRVQADHFQIFNKHTVSNNDTGKQIMKFPLIMHSLFD